MNDNPKGKRKNINRFALYASGILNSVNFINAVVSPQPGHLNPKNVFHIQGIKIFILKTDFNKTEIIK